MRTSVALLLYCLLLLNVQGMMIVSRGRCLCIGPGVNFIRPRSIKTIEVYFPSTFCEKMEVIVTLKNKKVQKCLNPDSEFAKNFIRNTQRSKRRLKTTES
ncbi:C-X-C motif chemokine 11-like [Scleropages formosus]|uniref:C-X-C motif chemokine n=1 Tax=Scleropages formosus TaxID=113540 RepID=A0A8C9V6I9_SCLFO|nr:C-X-C motif chemokine 11-like [Scleropages formosus]